MSKLVLRKVLPLFSHAGFTTEPKLRRLTWHKQQSVKNRACALQESFYPTTQVSYAAVKKRMASLLGIVDRASVLAYLGRPAYQKRQRLDQEVIYRRSGTIVNKTHTFIHRLPEKKGYIELFGLGYCYSVKDEWFIHWNHTTQETLPTQLHNESSIQKGSIENISLTKIQSQTQVEVKDYEDAKENVALLERKKYNNVSQRERNCESESNLEHTTSITEHTNLTKFEQLILKSYVKEGVGYWL